MHRQLIPGLRTRHSKCTGAKVRDRWDNEVATSGGSESLSATDGCDWSTEVRQRQCIVLDLSRPFRVTWRHRSRDHLIARMPFPIGGPLWPNWFDTVIYLHVNFCWPAGNLPAFLGRNSAVSSAMLFAIGMWNKYINESGTLVHSKAKGKTNGLGPRIFWNPSNHRRVYFRQTWPIESKRKNTQTDRQIDKQTTYSTSYHCPLKR